MPEMQSNTSLTDLEFQLQHLKTQVVRLQEENRRLCAEKKEFMSIFDGFDAGIYVADPDSHEILYVNNRLRRARPEGDVIGKKCYELLQGLEAPCEFCTNQTILADPERNSHIWDFQNKMNGRWYRCIDKAITWPDGRTVRYEVAFDIHKRKMAELALEESEAKYSVLVEGAHDGVLILQDGVCKFANSAMEKMSGYHDEDIIGRPFVDLVTDKFRESVAQGVNEVLQGDVEYRLYESRLCCKDGSEKDIEVSRAVIQFHGRPAVLSVVRDVGQRKAAEEALRVSEERYRLLEEYLSENIPLHIGATDSSYRFIVWNRYSEEMLGYSATEAIGKLTPATVHEHPWEAQMVVRAVEEHGLYDGEVNFLHKNGSLVPVHLVVVPKTNLNGDLVGLYGYAEDISVRKSAENALRESEKRFRDLVEFSLAGIFIVQDQQVVYCNPEQERLFGVVELPCDVDKYIECILPEDREKIIGINQDLYDTQPIVKALDIKYVSTNTESGLEQVRWAHCIWSRIHYNRKRAHLINMMDITRTKELESLLRVEDKMASLGRVAAGIAHEIRSPLSGINVLFHAAESIFLNREDNDPDIEKALAIIDKAKEASLKIEAVVRRVLDFSKPSNLQFRPTSIKKPVIKAVQMCAAAMHRYAIRLDMELPHRMPTCYIDVHMIEQVIVNLITNASESMSEIRAAKVVRIRAGRKGKFAYVSVGDSGKGVPESLKEKVFDPYFTTKDAGSGIGLSICHRIIKDHGGLMEVSKSDAGGAEFVLKIPILHE